MKPDELSTLVQILNPDKEEGKIMLITRYGADKVALIAVAVPTGYHTRKLTYTLIANTVPPLAFYLHKHRGLALTPSHLPSLLESPT